ncbi:MAG TPA: hypothetical protein VI413_00615 [Paludibacter sp.]
MKKVPNVISHNPTHKCHSNECDQDGEMCMELYKEIYLCRSHFREFIDKTTDELRTYLSDKGFDEKTVNITTHQPIHFVNKNLQIYFRPMFLEWRIKDKSKLINDFDITHVRFDFDTFTISDQEKQRLWSVFSEFYKG